jgi:hypothetical protein
MYGVESPMWIRVSHQHFDGPTKSWIHSIKATIPRYTWVEFCKLFHDRFDRDQHEILIRQLFSIKQTTSVSAYVTLFAELVDQLSSYSTSIDPLYYTMRFIDGLKPEIHSIVLMQRPKDLDTACTLALL